MLVLPEKGFARSINSHNVNVGIMCDWLEGSALFSTEEEVSFSDVVDALKDSHIYSDQDFAFEMVGNAVTELRYRNSYSDPNLCLEFARNRIIRHCTWQEVPAYSFCVMLALRLGYPTWFQNFGDDVTEQGLLFEEITQASLLEQFPNWASQITGWSRDNTVKISEAIQHVSQMLGEDPGAPKWVDQNAKEAGLDVILFRPFSDRRAGFPTYLIQCASGIHWKDKIDTPRITTWQKLVDFTVEPKRGVAIPFVLQQNEYARTCKDVQGLFLDRLRILSASYNNRDAWLSEDLKARIIHWLTPRIDALPYLGI